MKRKKKRNKNRTKMRKKRTNSFDASVSIRSEKAESQLLSTSNIVVVAGFITILLLLPYAVSVIEYSDLLRVLLEATVPCLIA